MHVIPEPSGGGAEKLVAELHAEALRQGRDSHVVYLSSPRFLDSGKRSKNTYFLGFKHFHDPVVIMKLRRTIKRLSRHRENCVVHAHLTWPFFFVPFATAFLGVQLVFTEHNTTNKRRRLHYWRFVEALFYARYRAIICISCACRDSLLSWLPLRRMRDSCVVVYNGVRLFPFAPRRPKRDSDYHVVSVGSLTSQKGFDIAIRALAAPALHQITYNIVGTGPNLPALKALARSLGVEDRVTFAGWSDDVESFLLNSDLCLIPSKWEGFGLVAVEALSTGLPVVASDVPGLAEVIAHCKAVRSFRVGDVDSLVQVLSSFLCDLNSGLSVDKEARARAEQFSFDKMFDGYWRQYKQICESNL